jgi:hypothetical protein
LTTSWESGQAFRWLREQEEAAGWFSGVVRGNPIKIRQNNRRTVELHSSQPAELARHLLHSYFRLGDEAEAIYQKSVEMGIQRRWCGSLGG